MHAASPKELSLIDYEGACDRLTWRPPVGDVLDFKIIFHSLSREHRAQMELQEEGQFGRDPREPSAEETSETTRTQTEFWEKENPPERPPM